jgi:phage tail-like protein
MALETGDVVAGYSFQVEIDGVTLAQFKEVSGISSEIQVIEHRENTKGGIPVMKKLPGHRKSGDITLKRGRTDDKALWDWHKKVQDGDIKGARKNGSIVLYDYAHGELSRWNFVAGWPSKVSIGQLQAQGNDVLVEECNIAHEGISPA